METKQKQHETVGALYPDYLHAADLDGPLRVTIARADVRSLPMPGGWYGWRCVLTFEEDPRPLVVNKTQATAIAELAGSDSFTEWPGVAVVLAPGVSHNRRPTIVVLQPDTIPA